MKKRITKSLKFNEFGEQLRAIAEIERPGGSIDTRLINSAAGASEGVMSDGGYLVQQDFASDLLKSVYEGGDLLSKVTNIPISTRSNSLKINLVDEASREDGYRWGGVQVYWEKEAGKISESKPKFKQLTLTLGKLTGLCYATDELLEDVSALGSVIHAAFSDEFIFKLEDAILRGSGAGEPLGILNSDALAVVSKESGQTDIICVENLLKMLASCYDKYGRAEWYINGELRPYLYKLKIGDTPVYLPNNSIAGAPFGILLGKPVNFIEQASAPGDVGDILLADMKEYIITDKSNIKAQSSIHVRFIYDETAFKFVYRVDGMPKWNSTITPYKGSLVKSPFVALEARI